eukprot:scaffold67833_cov52-Cyclotella_meneghiniana.AAC.3
MANHSYNKWSDKIEIGVEASVRFTSRSCAFWADSHNSHQLDPSNVSSLGSPGSLVDCLKSWREYFAIDRSAGPSQWLTIGEINGQIRLRLEFMSIPVSTPCTEP